MSFTFIHFLIQLQRSCMTTTFIITQPPRGLSLSNRACMLFKQWHTQGQSEGNNPVSWPRYLGRYETSSVEFPRFRSDLNVDQQQCDCHWQGLYHVHVWVCLVWPCVLCVLSFQQPITACLFSAAFFGALGSSFIYGYNLSVVNAPSLVSQTVACLLAEKHHWFLSI